MKWLVPENEVPRYAKIKIIKVGSSINTKEQSKSEQRITSHSYQHAPKPHVQQHTCEKQA